jgi:cytochrome c peroxidase
MRVLFNTRKLAPAVAVTTALILAACGGGTDSNNSSGQTQAPSDPDPSGLGVNASGKYADERGFYPDAAGFYPDSHGQYPDSNGNYPTAAEAGVFENDAGMVRSYSTLGPIDKATNPFFKVFGSNGRSCASCHVQEEGFSMTTKGLQARFNATDGADPVFSLNDGANSPNAPIGTLSEKRAAFSMLLNKGVIRVGMPVPTVTNDTTPKAAEFTLSAIDDPYGYAKSSELSLFRRPLPSTNLRFLATVMWDSRETVRIPYDPLSSRPKVEYCLNISLATPAPCFAPFSDDLKTQASNATTGHAQAGAALTSAEQQAILDFEMSLFTAQEYDKSAGFLTSAKSKAGTKELTTVDYYFEINSVAGDPKTGKLPPVTKLTVMQLFTNWLTNVGTKDAAAKAARESIARGEKIFNTRTFTMVDVQGTGTNPVTGATCTNCHSTPQVGSLSQANLFNIGVSDEANRTADMPLYTFKKTGGFNANPSDKNAFSKMPLGTEIKVTDPGFALVSGKWTDLGRFKVPSLRGLAARAPYFHDGSAKTIEDTTTFYNKRFNMSLTAQEMIDLNAFLRSL